MTGNRLVQLTRLGQSVWYDYIRRDLYEGPALRRLIEEDGLTGMTSNPTIFERAIAHTDLYDQDILRLAAQRRTPAEIFDAVALEDVRRAADCFRSVFDATGGADGFVSIEIRPQLAHDTEGSIAEARRLWKACDRPNVMIKIPATREGVQAIHRCLSEGININITLLFSLERYREVMEAYLSALETRVSWGRPVDGIRSVESFFISRVDTHVDARLDAIARDLRQSNRDRRGARSLRGKVAIANAQIAFQAFEGVFHGPRFARLEEKGGHVQRPLWASTSTKDPAYPDLYYVEALVAPRTMNTLPPETLQAYKREGNPVVRIYDNLPGASAVFDDLAQLRSTRGRLPSSSKRKASGSSPTPTTTWCGLSKARRRRCASRDRLPRREQWARYSRWATT
jgi:transaldolase